MKNQKTVPIERLCPYPKQIEWHGDYLRIAGEVRLVISKNMSADAVDLFKSTWNNFTQSKVKLTVVNGGDLPQNSFLLAVGDEIPASAGLNADSNSALTIDKYGAAGCGMTETDMKYCWFSMLQMLVCENTPRAESWLLPLMSMQDAPALKFRGIHLCVFPETTLEFIEKIIRLAAFLKFSHVVLEFWGMLKYETLRELAWPHAYSKEQVGRLLRTARQMGIQPVPMFNHWGHASGSRITAGRHVALDQNAALEPLFEPDGWTWCLTNPSTLTLLKDVRAELMELFGKTDYFHLGCDEAYSHATCPECRRRDSPRLLADYLNSINDDLKRRNVRPFIWGDAMLEFGKWEEGYDANSRPDQRTHEALDMLSRDFIINDWQYYITDKTKTATVDWFIKKGFEVITAPSLRRSGNVTALADIAIAKNAFGMLLTTWHILPTEIGGVAESAAVTWGGDFYRHEGRLATLAAYVRKLRGGPSDFKNAGWKNCEIDDSSQL